MIKLQRLISVLLALPSLSLFFLNKFILFIYFWLHWVFVAAHRLSLVVVSGLLFVAVHGLLIAVLLLLSAEHGL